MNIEIVHPHDGKFVVLKSTSNLFSWYELTPPPVGSYVITDGKEYVVFRVTYNLDKDTMTIFVRIPNGFAVNL